MTSPKILIAGFAILAAGAVAGWSASRAVDETGAGPLTTSAPPAVVADGGSNADLTPRKPYTPSPPRQAAKPKRVASGITVAAGTPFHVVIDETVSSATARLGESWTGVVAEPIYRNGRLVVPAGSPVTGTVVAAQPAERGDRARLQLALSSVLVNGRRYAVRATAEPVVAGSPRGRNLGAIAGSAAAGALIGRAIGGSNKSTLIGAAVGGGAATAVVAASKGYQATVPAGAEVEFVTTQGVTVRA